MLSVNFNPIILYNKNLNRTKKVNNTQNQQQDKLNNVYYYTSGITFKSSQTKKSDKFYNAKNYLNSLNISKDTNIYNLNLEKLDGIQEGLKTFEGHQKLLYNFFIVFNMFTIICFYDRKK